MKYSVFIFALIVMMIFTTAPAESAYEYQDEVISFIAALHRARDESPVEREKSFYSLNDEYHGVRSDMFLDSLLLDDCEEIVAAFESVVAREVIYYIENDESPEVRLAALRLFNSINVPKAEDRRVLGIAIDDIDTEVRLVAIDSIGSYLYSYPHREYEPFLLLYMKGLRDKDPRVRIEAIEIAYSIRENQAIQSAIYSLLQDEDYNVRLEAAIQLAIFDLTTEESLTILLEAFRKNPNDAMVISSLCKFGSMAQSAIPGLIDIINTLPTHPTTSELLDRWKLGDDLVDILRENKPDSPLLAELDACGADSYELDFSESGDYCMIDAHWENGWSEFCTSWTSDHSIRVRAISALARISGEPEIVDFIITLFEDEYPGVRAAAAGAFRLSYIPDEKVIPLLIDLLANDSAVNVRKTAANILSLQATGVPQALPAMISSLNDEDSSIRGSALWYIHQLGPDAADAVPALARRLPDADDGEQRRIINVLELIGEAASPAIPVVVEKVNDPDRDVAEAACLFLQNFPSHAESIMPIFMDRLRNSPDDVPYYEAQTLGILGKNIDGIKTELIEMLNDERPKIQINAVIALGAMGSAAADIVPIFLDMLKSGDDTLRCRVAFAFGDIGPGASPAVPLLIEMLGDENLRIVLAALDGISGIGSNAADAIPIILDMIETNDPYIHGNLILSLGDIGTNNPEIIPFLIDLLASEDDGTRWGAARVLGNFGPDASDALPLLREYIDFYDDEWFEMAFIRAIEEIEGRSEDSE